MSEPAFVVDHRNTGAAFRRLSLPIAVQELGDQLLGIADTIALGTVSASALAGATAATTADFTFVLVLGGLWSGLSIVAAQRVGANDMDGFARTVRAGFLIPTLAAASIALASLVFAGPLMHLMLGNAAASGPAANYLILRCIALVPVNVSGTLIVGLGAAGNRKLGVYLLAIINVIHIPLLLALALGWWTGHAYGLTGAGISTLLAETIAAIAAVVYALAKPSYRIFAGRSFDWALARRCAWLGLPESIFGVALVAPDMAIVGMLAPLGAATIGAFRALNVVSGLTFIVPGPLQIATQTVIGQRLGAGDPAGAREFLRRALRTALAVTTLTGILVALCSWPLAYVFTLNAAIATLAAGPLALHMVTMPIKGWAMVALSPVRAAGDTRFSMSVGILSGALVLPVTWFCIERLHAGLYGVPIAWIIAWSARAAVTGLKIRNGAWSTRAPLAA
jgi:putative MATE family efflux protein